MNHTVKQTKVELSFRAEKIVGGDIGGSKSDPKCFVYLDEVKVGVTETVNNNHNPEWSKRFTLKYFGKNQKLRFEVKDDDGWRDKLIGTCYAKLSDIVLSEDKTISLQMERTVYYQPAFSTQWKSKQKKTGTLIICGDVFEDDVFHMSSEGMTPEEQYKEIQKVDVNAFRRIVNYVYFHVVGVKLKRMDGLLGKSDPYFVLYKPRKSKPDEWQKFFTSETIKEDLNPKWQPQKFLFKDFCEENVNQKLKIEVYDWNSSSMDELIGFHEFTIQDFVDSPQKMVVDLKYKKKKKGRGKLHFNNLLVKGEEEYNQEMMEQWKACRIKIMDAVIRKQVQWEQEQYIPTFIKLLHRHEMKMMVAVDCCSPQLPISNPNCEHFLGTPDIPRVNDFQKALKEVGDIVLGYNNAHQNIPFYGFCGYREKTGVDNVPVDTLMDFFAMNGDIHNPDVDGIGQLLNVYKDTIRGMKMGTTRNINPMLEQIREKVYEESLFNQNKYFILLILISGDYTANDPSAIINRFCDLPISIIIVGVGDSSMFTKMRALDELNEDRGDNRDICQFVKYRECGEGTVARNVLREFPQQVVEYNRMKHGKNFTKEEVDWMIDDKTAIHVQKIQELEKKNMMLEERIDKLEKMILEKSDT